MVALLILLRVAMATLQVYMFMTQGDRAARLLKWLQEKHDKVGPGKKFDPGDKPYIFP